MVYIKATFNNTTVSITDMKGAVIAWGSGGRSGFKGSRKSTSFAATVIALEELGIGVIAFSPLAQGLLTNKYLSGIPDGSRATQGKTIREGHLCEENIKRIKGLNEIAQQRGQSLAQMAIAWVLKDSRVTTALIGASSVGQLENSYGALENLVFSEEELREIDVFAQDGGINIWSLSSTS